MKSYFKFLSRNKLYTAIEAFGLSVALAFVMILVSYAFMEYRVGTHQRNAKNLYVLGMGDDFGMTLNTGKEFLPSIPEVKEWTRFGTFYTNKGAMVHDQYYKVQALAVDSNFLSMFGFKCSGCPTQRILTDKHQVIVSESFAKKAFGDVNPIGQVVRCDTLQFKVVGVMEDFGREDLFDNTDLFVSMKFKEEELASFPMTQFGEIVTVARLSDYADPVRLKETLLKKYMSYWKDWTREKTAMSFLWGSSLVRWDKVYFSGVACSKFRHGSQKMVNILLLVALVLLLSAIFNYINLTVAQIGNRAKEMATRRLLGESILGVVMRYVKEAALFTAVCFLLGVLVAWAFVPLFDSILDTRISLFSSPAVWGCLLLAYLIVALLSGILPAIVVSRFNPIDVVKGTIRLRSKMWFSKIFIVVQSIISMILVVMAVTMMLQMRHLANRSMGYNTKDIINIATSFGSNHAMQKGNAVLIARLKSLPEVEEATAIGNNPINSFANCVFNENGKIVSYVRVSVLDSTAMNMLGFKVLERYGEPTSGKLWLSEEAKRAFGVSDKHPWFGDNEGKHGFEVCGIVKDFHCGDALDDTPLAKHNAICVPSEDNVLWSILVKTRGDHAEALSKIQNVCKQVAKEQIGVPTDMEMEYLDDSLADALKEKHNMMVLIITFMGISILISALGLFGMSVYYGRQQKKQIALRKVMGASVMDAAWQLSKRFLVTSCVAVVIAIPLCVKLMQEYLIGFNYRIAFPWWALVAGAIFTLVLALASVFCYTLRTALANPIDSIKME